MFFTVCVCVCSNLYANIIIYMIMLLLFCIHSFFVLFNMLQKWEFISYFTKFLFEKLFHPKWSWNCHSKKDSKISYRYPKGKYVVLCGVLFFCKWCIDFIYKLTCHKWVITTNTTCRKFCECPVSVRCYNPSSVRLGYWSISYNNRLSMCFCYVGFIFNCIYSVIVNFSV